MTKRMIDSNELLEWVQHEIQKIESSNIEWIELQERLGYLNALYAVKKKINKLISETLPEDTLHFDSEGLA